LKSDAIKRCFQNLLDNSFKYGNAVIINSYIIDDALCIEIHDDGPGIPESKREEVFKPFFRLDESRSKETGGVGLGLAITRDIIGNHGGQIHFESSELLSGLKAVISLPL
jgi:two-component system, OmpR family, osmolarity sensor histidine kinase EnvZ